LWQIINTSTKIVVNIEDFVGSSAENTNRTNISFNND